MSTQFQTQMENLRQHRKKKQQKQPLLVYHRRRKKTTETSCKKVVLNDNIKYNKPIIVYRRKKKRITTDFNAVKREGEHPYVDSSCSPIVCTSITDFQSTRSNAKSDGIEFLGFGEIKKKRVYDLRSSRISRSVESQLSATAGKEAKPDVSTTSDLTQVIHVNEGTEVNHAVQRAKSTNRRRGRYLKYSTILKKTSYGICSTEVIEYGKDSNAYKEEENCMALLKNASCGIHRSEFIEYGKNEVYKEAEACMANLKNTSYGICRTKFFEYGNDSNIYKEVEDYMGDERKHKITRTIESLYASPIVFEDFCMKHRYLEYSTILKDLSHKNGNFGIAQHGVDPELYIEDEDYMGDERKEKITKSMESLYIRSIVIDDYHIKPWNWQRQ